MLAVVNTFFLARVLEQKRILQVWGRLLWKTFAFLNWGQKELGARIFPSAMGMKVVALWS